MNNYFGQASEEEIRQATLAVNHRIAQKEQRQARAKGIMSASRKVFFIPLSIALSVVSLVSKIVGYALALTLPYGLYQAYKVALRLYEGVPFFEIGERWLVLGFVVFPFTAFFVHVTAQMLSKYLRDNI